MGREGNNPKRRIAASGTLDLSGREELAARLKYVGSAHHKCFPANYGFNPPSSPRPWKSVCDGKRIVLKEEAENLLRVGVMKEMFSPLLGNGFPKYVWSVDNSGDAYEAKTDSGNPGQYHGYRLEEDDPMRAIVLNTWNKRCRQA